MNRLRKIRVFQDVATLLIINRIMFFQKWDSMDLGLEFTEGEGCDEGGPRRFSDEAIPFRAGLSIWRGGLRGRGCHTKSPELETFSLARNRKRRLPVNAPPFFNVARSV